ncbi:DUF2744 domain-containing protein [Nocardia asteroides]|uniref:phage gene 29 protein family protein n=1 Tax=Nocardia asteroides TaxID=1824 RepID=UPI0037C7632F
MALKTQAETNFSKPAEHFGWALRNVPGIGSDVSIPAAWAEKISTHLSELGFVFGPHLLQFADADGNIPASKIPVQTKKLSPPFRGPHTHFNPAVTWVPMDTPEPNPVVLPDVNKLTTQERQALLDAFRARGDIADPEPPPNFAAVLDG